MSNHIPFSMKKSVRLLSACMAAVAMAQTIPALAQGQDTLVEEGNEEGNIEEVVVSGIRSSISNALEIKRQTVGISDVISADDISSMPDENLAESIQRLPGVQIERVDGRGALIGLRGLGPTFTKTTLNGQTFASSQFTDGFRFDIVQSEVASHVQIFKSPSAEHDEGGLSGSINIGTARPLAFNERRVLLKAEGITSSDRDSTNPGGSFTYIDQFNNDRLGVLFNVAYQELETRFDLMWNQRFADVDADGDGQSDFTGAGIPFERTNRPRLRRQDVDTERLLFNGAIQYFFNDDLELNITAVRSEDDRELNLQQLVPLFGGGDPPPTLTLGPATDDGTVQQVLAENARVEANHTFQTEDRESEAYTAELDWQINNNFKGSGVLHYTSGSKDEVERAAVLGIRSDLEVDLNPSNPVFISNGLNPVSDPDSWVPENLFRNDIAGQVDSVETDEFAAQLDLEYALDMGILQTTFKTGAKYREQTLDRTATRFDRNFQGENVDDSPFPSVAEANIVVKDFTDGEYPGIVDFVLPDINAFLNAFDASGLEIEPNFQPAQFFEIDRDITNFYLQLDFSVNDKLRGNYGLRYQDTQRDIDTMNFDNGIQVTTGAFTDIGGDGTPTSTSFSYDSWLPSLNLAYDVTDNFVVRAAAAQVLVRPVIGDTANFSRSIQVTDDGSDVIFTVDEGSFDLEALTADQWDVSAEWFFDDSSVISVAFFSKDIQNQVVSETVCPSDFGLANVSFDAATNECRGEDGNIYNITRTRPSRGVLEVTGWELAYSQAFDFLPSPFDGFGVVTNYTILDADNPDEAIPLRGSSEETGNFIGYYEKGGFAARVAFNYRSSFNLDDGVSGDNFGPSSEVVLDPGRKMDSRNQIDVSLSYQFDSGLKLSMEGINVNDDTEKGTRFVGSRLQSVATFGPTWFWGASYEF